MPSQRTVRWLTSEETAITMTAIQSSCDRRFTAQGALASISDFDTVGEGEFVMRNEQAQDFRELSSRPGNQETLGRTKLCTNPPCGRESGICLPVKGLKRRLDADSRRRQGFRAPALGARHRMWIGQRCVRVDR